MLNRWFFFITFFVSFFSHSQNKTYQSQIDSIFDKAFSFYLSDKDSLSFYLDKVNQLAIENSDIESLCDSYNVESWNASYIGDLGLMKKNIYVLDSLINNYQTELNQSKKKLYYICQTDYTKGQYHNELKEYDRAKFYFDKIISECEKLKKNEISEDLMILFLESNIYIGLMLSDENKFSLAEEYFNKNIRLIGNNAYYSTELNNTKMHLANIYKKNKDYKKSNTTILNCIPFYKSKNNSNRLITGYRRIIDNHIAIKQLDSARYYLQLLKQQLPDQHQLSHLFYEVNSNILESNQELSKAIASSYKRLELLKVKWKERRHVEIAEAHNRVGELYSESNNQKEAIRHFDIALTQLSGDSVKPEINQTTKLKVLKNKSQSLNTLKKYRKTTETVNIAISVLDSLKPSFDTRNDKLFLIENTFPLFENGIEAAYKLFQKTTDFKYIDEAFFYFEKSKSTLLLESLLITQANKFTNVPKSLIEREKELKAKINYVEKHINKKSTKELQDELFNLKQKHRELINNIEISNQQYYDLKYNTNVLPIDNLQNWLDDNTMLISYFYANKTIYTITITNTSKHIEKLSIDESFEILLKDSYNLLSSPKSDQIVIKEKTHKLYQKLLKPSIDRFSKENLIIIPDGLLNYLPYGCLSHNGNNYLIENHSISYANSATLLKRLQIKNKKKNQVIAFAPKFDSTSELLPITNNTQEVSNILTHFNGKAFVNNNASLSNFNTYNKDYGIIHLATHAIIDDQNPKYSYLAFSPVSEENLLYTNDLYNLDLNSNMVTLSACETGIGDLKRGEGMLSLAHGFYFSGTLSIASTLWKVNDASSSQLMSNFYKHLADGNSKDIALKNAKLDFISINKDNNLSHPYYWSGFIISGNTTALASNNNWLYISLSVLFLILIGIFLNRKKRSN